MRAVGADMIRAECEKSCAADWELPLVRDGSELIRHSQARLRAMGRWIPPDSLELGGGVRLRVVGAPASDDPPDANDEVIVVGTFTSSASHPILDAVSAIAEND